MKSLRIILVMLEPPLPFGNAGARWFYVLLRTLVARGHQVTAFAACSNPDDIKKAQQLFPSPAFDLRCYRHPQRRGFRGKWRTLRRPYSYTFSQTMLDSLHAELERGYDVLHLEQLWCGWAGWDYAKKALLSVHFLPSIDQQGERRLLGAAERTLMRRAQRKILRRFPHIRSCSSRMVPEIREYNPRASIGVGALGMDLSLYPFLSDSARPKAPVVGLIGSMDWIPTRTAAVRLLTRLWPEIKKQVPDAKLRLVGWNAKRRLEKLVAGRSDILIEENIPDARPFFEETSVLLYAPNHGSGMKIKVLESLAYGLPVVTNSAGAEGLQSVSLRADDGKNIALTDDDAGLIARTVELLKDPSAQNRQRRAGRELVEAVCGAKATVDQVEAQYAEILGVQGTSEAK